MDRRKFLTNAVGMCTALLVDELTGCSSKTIDTSKAKGAADAGAGGGGGSGTGGASATGGESATGGASVDGGSGSSGTGGSAVSQEAGVPGPLDPPFTSNCPSAVVPGNEFIFDVETHWFSAEDVANFPAYAQAFGPLFQVASESNYIQSIFCGSDTTVACLGTWPGILCTADRTTGCGVPLSNQHIVASRDKINALAGGSHRVFNHTLVLPQDPSGIAAQLAVMAEFHTRYGVAAWELYPGFKPGFRLDGADGLADKVILKGLQLGVNRFCIHKGAPIGNFFDTTANYPDDIGPAALKYPDANFIVCHAAICAGLDTCSGSMEGPFNPDEAKPTGTNALIRSLIDSGIGPGGNVYASTGRAFSQVMTDLIQSVHFFGKLLKYLGPDNVLWGSDAVGNSNPQQLIEAFRSLTIPQDMQDQYGYPELTAEVKTKILGLNAARLYGVDPANTRCRVSSCA